MKTVTIIVDGGVVQQVIKHRGAKDVRVIVKDHDNATETETCSIDIW